MLGFSVWVFGWLFLWCVTHVYCRMEFFSYSQSNYSLLIVRTANNAVVFSISLCRYVLCPDWTVCCSVSCTVKKHLKLIFSVSVWSPEPTIHHSLKAELACWGRGDCRLITYRVVGLGGQLLFPVVVVSVWSVADCDIARPGLALCVLSLLPVGHWKVLSLHFFKHCSRYCFLLTSAI